MMQILLLVIALSLDTFMASVAYGASKIRIPIRSMIALTSISSLSLVIAVVLGNGISTLLPIGFARGFSFTVLFLLGMSRFLEGVLKEFLKKYTVRKEPILFRFLDFHFIVEVYADNTKADKDDSKSLSVKEALTLGLVLSLDGIAAGVGSGLLIRASFTMFCTSFLAGMIAIWIGSQLGEKINQKWNLGVSWLSGILLMIVALLRAKIF